MRFSKLSALLFACAAGAFAWSSAEANPGNPGGGQFESRVARLCADQGNDRFAEGQQAKRAERVAEVLKLTDVQKAAFKELQEVRAKNHAAMKAAICAAKPDLSTFEKKLEFRETVQRQRVDALSVEIPKLSVFYKTLDVTQKAEFEKMTQQGRRGPDRGMRGFGGGGLRGPGGDHGGPGHGGEHDGSQGLLD